jgi:hypothetical protein
MEISAIETIKEKQETYTLELSGGDNFVANSLLVKVEKPKAATSR